MLKNGGWNSICYYEVTGTLPAQRSTGAFWRRDPDRANHPRLLKLPARNLLDAPPTAPLLPAYVEESLRVSRYSVIHRQATLLVPSRLIGERVQVRRTKYRLEVYYGGARQVHALVYALGR